MVRSGDGAPLPVTRCIIHQPSVKDPRPWPGELIKTLDFVETERIDLTGKKEEFTARQIPVSVSNPKAAVLNTVVDVIFSSAKSGRTAFCLR